MRGTTILVSGIGGATAVAAALLASGVLAGEGDPGLSPDETHDLQRASAPVVQGEFEAPEPERQDPELPPEVYRKFPPGSRVRFHVPRTDSGIPLPDGTFLPLLNGVPHAPPLSRIASLGPVPPVIGKIVDDTGVEWWEHEDGSVTTTRYVEVTVSGETTRRVVTDHGNRIPDDRAVPRDEPKPPEKKLGPRVK